MKKHYRHEEDCLNCGTQLHGHFCHVCGQENLQIKENFGHLMQHAVADYFHFDEKFFHTLKPLLFKPGKLTIDYMAGKRTQYLHPIRIYIFISLVFFLLYFNSGPEQQTTATKSFNKEHFTDSLNNALRKQGISVGYKKKLGYKIGKTDSIKIYKYDADNSDFDISPLARMRITGDSKDTSYAQYLQSQQKLSPGKRDGFLNRLYTKKKFEWKAKGIKPKDAIVEGFKHNFPKLMFILLPLFALLLRFAFWKNHKYYVEHLIYAFHLHSFIFLFSTFIILIDLALPQAWGISTWLSWLAYIVVIWYIYRSLRVIYQRSRWRTISKMTGLFFSYSITFSFCALLFLMVIAVFS